MPCARNCAVVAPDGRATLIIAELLDEARGAVAYTQLHALTEQAPEQGEENYVAGEGAVQGYLGAYINADAQRLHPMAALLITGVQPQPALAPTSLGRRRAAPHGSPPGR